MSCRRDGFHGGYGGHDGHDDDADGNDNGSRELATPTPRPGCARGEPTYSVFLAAAGCTLSRLRLFSSPRTLTLQTRQLPGPLTTTTTLLLLPPSGAVREGTTEALERRRVLALVVFYLY